MTLKNIEVFVDATPEGEKRVDYAATLAHQCGAHLAGIHVVSAVRPEYRPDYYVIGEKAIRAMLGSPVADLILSYAADHGIDLIVIGAYSHARSVEMVFGGVTRTLLKQAPVPVLMSR